MGYVAKCMLGGVCGVLVFPPILMACQFGSVGIGVVNSKTDS